MEEGNGCLVISRMSCLPSFHMLNSSDFCICKFMAFIEVVRGSLKNYNERVVALFLSTDSLDGLNSSCVTVCEGQLIKYEEFIKSANKKQLVGLTECYIATGIRRGVCW